MSRRTRKASLRVEHSRTCQSFGKSSLTSVAKGADCACQPRYYTFFRNGGVHKGTRVHDRAIAHTMLRQLQAQLDEGASGIARPKASIDFPTWATEFVEGHRGTESTKAAYRPSLELAKKAIGHKPVREIEPSDIRRFLSLVDDGKRSPDTQAKHLRHLSACLAAAVPEYADRNPVADVHSSQRPKAKRGRDAYFTDEEVPRLLAGFKKSQASFLFVTRFAVATGMRQGEIVSLKWGDVHLGEGFIDVQRSFNQYDGERDSTKTGRDRVVQLTPDARRVLEEWIVRHGFGGPGELVFTSAKGRRLNGNYVTKVLKAAMKRAGISDAGERGSTRDFHSTRATYARLMLEAGVPISYVADQLGHSSITITREKYGRWSKSGERRQAEQLPVGTLLV